MVSAWLLPSHGNPPATQHFTLIIYGPPEINLFAASPQIHFVDVQDDRWREPMAAVKD